MDRDLSVQELKRRSRKKWIGAVAVLLLLGAGWLGTRYVFASRVSRADLRIVTAETGSVENTLAASGEALPELEQVFTSPITAIIKEVFLSEGTPVKPGDRILELDKGEARLSFEKQKDQLELKRNAIARLRMELAKSYFDLRLNDSIKVLRIGHLRAGVEDARRLHKAGGGTREDIEKAELDLRIAELEKRQLENDIKVKQQTMRTELRESELQASIQEKELSLQESRLRLADLVANRPGVLTWLNKAVGTTVREGEALARLADLKGYRITGSISDSYAEQVRAGMDATIRVGTSQLKGVVTHVHPTIQNGVMTFDVRLLNPSSPLLRPKQKVELFLTTSAVAGVTRVPNGAAFKGPKVLDVFVVSGDKAERRTVETGAANFDFVEIRRGLRPGEKVILNDLSEFKNLRELHLTE
ncbi:efflux RND transporter periplasmic adaptor subunit [Siphonobacter aquaeclarae]|uniref:HlyD family secretion protein n=1 Tax=Siphonobacter aquaeclarae TaxID=563176 RepID=A0A1G9TDH1_9BACT|nr:HlyD family efflux transporter periplasmic adaptor subunit [Siphonobacter aquaeclarae]SDM45769.1 HlyD family secretion protein [Siphonobacter aquaeclarae]